MSILFAFTPGYLKCGNIEWLFKNSTTVAGNVKALTTHFTTHYMIILS